MAKRLTKKEQEEFMKQYQQSRFSIATILGQVLVYSLLIFLILGLATWIKFMVEYLFL